MSRTWLSEVQGTKEFCTGGLKECVNPKLPDCEDRTVKCLDPLPMPDGMTRDNNTVSTGSAPTAMDSQSRGAKFTYRCERPGWVIRTSSHPYPR